MGIVFAAGNAIVRNSLLMMEAMSPLLPETDLMNALVTDSYSVSFLLGVLFDSVSIPLGLFFLFSIFRIVLRSQWLAGAALSLLINAYVNLEYPEVTGGIVAVVFSVLWLIAVMRFGLVAGMSMWFADRVFRAWSILAPAPGGWYSGRMYLLLASVLGLAIYAFITSLGGRPLVPAELLGDTGDRKNGRSMKV